jgi:hypothetical protein
MGAISLRLPESLHKFAREVAKDDDVSLNQLITTALAEKLSALKTESYLQERAARGSRKKFERVLNKVSKRPPIKGDEMP